MKSLFCIILFLCSLASVAQTQISDDVKNLRAYIDRDMSKTIRVCTNDTLGNFALPYPFSVPCIVNGFQNLFYWDTYFTNVGLLLDGNIEQAKNNIDNILAMIDRFGYMPNATNEGMMNRSQPPYASIMVREVYEITHDKIWLSYACGILEKEYKFWMTERITSNVLSMAGIYKRSGNLWEKYNAVSGDIDVKDEYAMPGAFMGWTAGVYIFAFDYCYK